MLALSTMGIFLSSRRWMGRGRMKPTTYSPAPSMTRSAGAGRIISAVTLVLPLMLLSVRTFSAEPDLFVAARDGDVALLEKLIAGGHDIDQTYFGMTPLGIAVQKGQEAGVEILIDHGADVGAADNHGRTLLHHAVTKGVLIVAKLLEAGVDVNARDIHGNTALIFAAGGRDEEIFDLLIEHGADVNLKGFQASTALIGATMNHHAERVVRLLDLGAEIDATDAQGRTALFFAVDHGLLGPNPDIARILLERGASTGIQDHRGDTTLRIAQRELKQFLKSERKMMKAAQRGELGDTTREELLRKKADLQEVVSMIQEHGPD